MAMPNRQPVKLNKVTVPGTKLELDVDLSHTDHPRIPEIQESYLFRTKLVKYVKFAIEARKNCLLTGDAGVGKSSLIEQMAALTRTPLWRLNLHGESDTTIFIGRDWPSQVDGKPAMIYKRGILARAMEEGHWLLLDEIDAALQPVLFVLQQVLEDKGKLMLEDGDATTIEKHPNFRIFATANTVGKASKNKLLYSGTMGRMNEATLDRFGVVVHVPYLEPADEEKVIAAAAPDVDIDFIKVIVRFANEIRTQLNEEQLTCTFSTRRCIDWAQAMDHFHPVEAARITVLDKLHPDDATVLEGILQRYFGE